MEIFRTRHGPIRGVLSENDKTHLLVLSNPGVPKQTLQVPMTFNFVLGNEDTVQVLVWNPQEIRSAHICKYRVFPKVLTYLMDVFRRVRKIAEIDY
jgi:hypothetical protein